MDDLEHEMLISKLQIGDLINSSYVILSFYIIN